jgi:calcium binding protein
MAPRPRSDLQTLIQEITVDCNDDDEELMGFENAFDEQADFPCPGTVIGEEVTVLSVATKNGRRELLAICEHHGRRYELALLDIQLHTDPTTQRLVAAYRHWASYR